MVLDLNLNFLYIFSKKGMAILLLESLTNKVNHKGVKRHAKCLVFIL